MGKIDVGRVVRGHPQIGVQVTDGHGGVIQESYEQPNLHQHQRDGEGHAGNSNEETQLIVQQVLPRKINHGLAPSTVRATSLPTPAARSWWRDATPPTCHWP